MDKHEVLNPLRRISEGYIVHDFKIFSYFSNLFKVSSEDQTF
jgi:hypothetical protein